MSPRRISVPLSAESIAAVRKISAEKGQSLAQILAEILQKTIDKFDKKEPSNEEKILEKILTEIEKNSSGSRVSLPEEAAKKLFETTFFCEALVKEISEPDLPGTPRQPMHVYLRAARQKAQQNFEMFLRFTERNPS